jgi:hypothetical protein
MTHCVELSIKHRRNGFAAFHRFDVPGERGEIAPEAFVAEQRRRAADIA